MSEHIIEGEYCKKPYFVSAFEWNDAEGHPQVIPFSERFPDENAHQECEACEEELLRHGVVEDGEMILTVCPSNVVIHETRSNRIRAVLPKMLFLMAYMKKPLPERVTPFSEKK